MDRDNVIGIILGGMCLAWLIKIIISMAKTEKQTNIIELDEEEYNEKKKTNPDDCI